MMFSAIHQKTASAGWGLYSFSAGLRDQSVLGEFSCGPYSSHSRYVEFTVVAPIPVVCAFENHRYLDHERTRKPLLFVVFFFFRRASSLCPACCSFVVRSSRKPLPVEYYTTCCCSSSSRDLVLRYEYIDVSCRKKTTRYETRTLGGSQ